MTAEQKSSMTAKPATPLPWTIDHECIAAEGQHISMAIGKDGATYAEQKQDAAYIVAACNSYPQLMAENERLREALRVMVSQGENPGYYSDKAKAYACEDARAALKGAA